MQDQEVLTRRNHASADVAVTTAYGPWALFDVGALREVPESAQ